ncbi:hypothetical protein LMQ09_14660, partial [Staphylococcus aureus]|uniref:hypothetical protein n=1 Tax=Staphylococcus aureus TaxID=1280 RepID=UPI001E5B89AD
ISIQEPLGDAVAGRVGACQTEICGLATEDPPEPDIVETLIDYAGQCGINGYPLVWNETYDWKPWIELSAAWLDYNK